MKILFLTMGYPSRDNPARLIFFKNLVDEIADQGNQCVVIAPARKNKSYEARLPYCEKQITKIGNEVLVYYPKYFSVWLKARSARDPFRNLSVLNFFKSVEKTIVRNELTFDCVYSHFLWVSAMAAAWVGEKYHVPAFGAAGESTFEAFSGFEREEVIKYLNRLTGIVSVSSENRKILLNNGVLNKNRISVFPNAVDTSWFMPHDKNEARKKLGIPNDVFVAGFVGHFIERKGPLRVEKATKRAGVNVIFAGKGDQKPKGDHILFCDKVEPKNMPVFLSAADVFVLPTQNEGCSNSIVEAMACGLPIISSKRSFNMDVLDSSCSILIDPDNINEISEAITKLKNDSTYREMLAKGALKKSASLTIEKRAVDILEWMKTMGEIKE